MKVSEKDPMMVISIDQLVGFTTLGRGGGHTITKDLGWGPSDARRLRVDTVANKLASSAYVVDGIFENLGASGSLDNCSRVSAHCEVLYTIADGTHQYRNRRGYLP